MPEWTAARFALATGLVKVLQILSAVSSRWSAAASSWVSSSIYTPQLGASLTPAKYAPPTRPHQHTYGYSLRTRTQHSRVYIIIYTSPNVFNINMSYTASAFPYRKKKTLLCPFVAVGRI